MRTFQGYVAFEVPVKSAGQRGQTFCRIRYPDGGYVIHKEIMAHLKKLCPNGKIAEIRGESVEARP